MKGAWRWAVFVFLLAFLAGVIAYGLSGLK